MALFSTSNWLKSPPDRDIIARWTKSEGSYLLDLPQPADPQRFHILAVGDTGDSEASGERMSPQDAVARELAADAALPGSAGRACALLHMGDMIYMTGERRLYDRNFRRPYTPFLTPESTVDNFVFQLPFLPVPGNHDYYDLGSWAMWLAQVPVLGAGLRALIHQLFAFSLPEGGSDSGRVYMEAFVDLKREDHDTPLPYRPGQQTRLPNRYYRFRLGSVDVFGLDSNTLDAPTAQRAGQVRAEAAEQVTALQARAKSLDRQLRRDQLALDRWRTEQRSTAAQDPSQRTALAGPVAGVTAALARLQGAIPPGDVEGCAAALGAVTTAVRRWEEAAADLAAGGDPDDIARALEELEEASDDGCASLRAVEGCLGALPEGPQRAELLAAREALEEALRTCLEAIAPLPQELCARIRRLSEEALDVQRDLAREQRRTRFRPDDFDSAQFAWLEAALAEAQRERPDGWRVLFMHHPLYSSIVNHGEKPDVQGVRENLLDLLRDRVHLVLGGHSHAFEWFRSSALPNTGLFVTGGGGQVTLRSSFLEPRQARKHADRYEALRQAGVEEAAIAGRGPLAEPGASRSLYHYLQIEVTPEALVVRPTGIRRVGDDYRREAPMPVFHAASLGEQRPTWKTRHMAGVEIRRGEPPRPVWGGK